MGSWPWFADMFLFCDQNIFSHCILGFDFIFSLGEANTCESVIRVWDENYVLPVMQENTALR